MGGVVIMPGVMMAAVMLMATSARRMLVCDLPTVVDVGVHVRGVP